MTERSAMDMRILAAEWVLPVSTPPIRDGAVVLAEGRIAWVGPRADLPSRFLKAPVRGFPRSLLLPGWVNAHSHLNLTAAVGLIPGTADHFADWVKNVIQFQMRLPDHLLRQSVVAGLDLLISTGTTTVAHVSTLPQLEPFLEHPMRSVVFHEPIGFRSDRASELLDEAEEWLDAAEALISDAEVTHVRLGLAPHAPYSVSPVLLRGITELASRRALPLSIHVSETRAEVEFLRGGEGELRELLVERGAWDPTWKAPGLSPVAYLAHLGVLGSKSDEVFARGMAVHCNYLTDKDLELLAQSRLIPTWCPGSHLFFGHRDHPARKMLNAGIPLALGTDSLASNAGLNMLREVRLAAAAFPEVDRRAWLRAGTLAGAEALGLGAVTGTLEAGKSADLQILQGNREDTTDPLAPLFEDNLRVRMVMVQGEEAKVR